MEESRKDELHHCDISLAVVRCYFLLNYEVEPTVVQMFLSPQLSEVRVTLTYVKKETALLWCFHSDSIGKE